MNVEPFQTVRSLWQRRLHLSPGAKLVALISLTVTTGVAGIQSLGWLQPLELWAYDVVIRQAPPDPYDERVLVVAITEDDLQRLQRPTPSDATLAEAIALLQQHHPSAIGIDLYRDIPQSPGRAALIEQLRANNVYVIQKLQDSLTGQGIAPPSFVPPERVGFNDLVLDPDGSVRRGLLLAAADDGTTYHAFALRLSLHFLAEKQIRMAASPLNAAYFQLGQATFIPLSAQDGGYQGIDSAGYQVMLQYRSPHHIAREVSLSDLLTGQVDPQWIQDAVVLIGTTAPSGKDLFRTPYSAGESVSHQMPGVHIHAQMVSQLLSAALDGDRAMQFFPAWAELVGLWGWVSVSAAVGWWLRRPLLWMGAVGAIAAGCVLGAVVLLRAGQIWVPMVAPTLGVVMSVGAAVVYRSHEANRQQHMVMRLLGQHTSPEIATAIWDNRTSLLTDGRLPGTTLTATILFSDIRNFSSIAEVHPPDQVLNWLNDYLEEMTQAIQQHQGIVNKFTGDGLMAVFGVPVPRTTTEAIAQDAQNAVSCALAMEERLKILNERWRTQNLPECQIRVGIFTGEVMVGSLGGKSRLEYGIIGDSVNIASRLESCQKDRHLGLCRTLIAQSTQQYLDPRFVLESWGAMALKGRSQPVQVYRVVGIHPLSSEFSYSSAIAPPEAMDETFTKTDRPILKNL